MKKFDLFLVCMLFVSSSQAQSNDIPRSGYLYKIEPGIPGKTIYICGERPFNTNGNLIAAGDLGGQIRQTFENIKTSLATVDMTLKDVTQIKFLVKGAPGKVSAIITSVLTDISALYLTPLPNLIDIKSIPKIVRDDVLIEIEVISIK